MDTALKLIYGYTLLVSLVILTFLNVRNRYLHTARRIHTMFAYVTVVTFFLGSISLVAFLYCSCTGNPIEALVFLFLGCINFICSAVTSKHLT